MKSKGWRKASPGTIQGLEVMEKVHRLTLQAEEEPENIEVRVELGNTFYDMGRYGRFSPLVPRGPGP